MSTKRLGGNWWTVAVAVGFTGLACCTGKNAPANPNTVPTDKTGEVVHLIPDPDAPGPSYQLEGPYALRGRLSKPAAGAAAWTLDARLTFPTGGYRVGNPRIMVKKSLPEQVVLIIPVTPPPPDAMVTQVITELPVKATVHAHDRARFEIRVETLPPGPPGR